MISHQLILLLAADLFFGACTNSTNQDTMQFANTQIASGNATSNCDASNTSQDLLTMSIGDLIAYKENRDSQNTQNGFTIAENKAVINALCSAAVSKRASCILANPIIPSGNNQSLSCSAGNSAAPSDLVIQLSAPSAGNASYVLVATTSGATAQLVSTPFKAGTSIITFKNVGAANRLAPQFKDIVELKIRSSASNWQNQSLFDKTGAALNLFYGTKKVLGGGFLKTPEMQGNSEYLVDIGDIASGLQSDGCIFTLDQVNQIKSAAAQPFVQQQASAIAASNQAHIQEQQQYLAMNNDSLLRCTLINQIKTLDAQIDLDTPQLETAIDTISSLSAELYSNANFGCQASQPITSLEVTFSGKVSDDPLPLSQTSIPSRNGGLSDSLIIKLGDSLSASGLDARSVIGAKYVFSNLQNVAIGAFSRIYIEKRGVKYSNNPQSCSNIGGAVGTAISVFWNQTCWLPTENDVVYIDEIQINANGKTLFSQKGLGIKLSDNGHHLNWEYPSDVHATAEWKSLMQETDCSAQQ